MLLYGPPSKITDSIYLWRFNEQEKMGETLLRFQEYYENPKFRGKVFTFKEFKDHYTKIHGAFTYTTDWEGFNFPSSAIKPFRDGRFKVITPEEWFVTALTHSIPEPYYIIAATKDADPAVLRHEMAHGLYATNADYRAEVHAIMEGVQVSPIIKWLWPNYHFSVFMDECHAYLLADFDYLIEQGLQVSELKEISDALNGAFNNYIPNISEFV